MRHSSGTGPSLALPSLAGGDATDSATIAYHISVALTKKEARRAEKEQVKAGKKLEAKGVELVDECIGKTCVFKPEPTPPLGRDWWLLIVFPCGEVEEEEEMEKRRRSPCSLAASCAVSWCRLKSI